jgi:hypothetical protein
MLLNMFVAVVPDRNKTPQITGGAVAVVPVPAFDNP